MALASPIRVLFDTGIHSRAGFAVPAKMTKLIEWGSHKQYVEINGLKRKPEDQDNSYQEQINAIWTIGRLAREEKINAYRYNEIIFEEIRATKPIPEHYALSGCNFESCQPAVERSKFKNTINFAEHTSKGGKKDKKMGKESEFGQIQFMQWLLGLQEEHITGIINTAKELGLTDFEVESLRQLDWFRFMCGGSGEENYPDIFHIWTAERNNLDTFLTLDKRIVNLVENKKADKQKRFQIKTEVIRPLELLKKLNVEIPDHVPIEHNHFYPF